MFHFPCRFNLWWHRRRKYVVNPSPPSKVGINVDCNDLRIVDCIQDLYLHQYLYVVHDSNTFPIVFFYTRYFSDNNRMFRFSICEREGVGAAKFHLYEALFQSSHNKSG